MIIALPGTKNAGKPAREPSNWWISIPTIADLAGVTPPKNLEGTSLRPLLEHPDAEWKLPALQPGAARRLPRPQRAHRALALHRVGFRRQGRRALRSRRDPQELRNLAANPLYAATVAEMKALLKTVHHGPVQRRKSGPRVFIEALGVNIE
jgi:arylsulfatase A-like enzyme